MPQPSAGLPYSATPGSVGFEVRYLFCYTWGRRDLGKIFTLLHLGA